MFSPEKRMKIDENQFEDMEVDDEFLYGEKINSSSDAFKEIINIEIILHEIYIINWLHIFNFLMSNA